MAKDYKCAFCDSKRLAEIIDFGDVALAGAFVNKAEIPKEKKYPLVVVFCEDCYVVQVRDHIDPEVLFAHDFYFSSAIKTLRDHFEAYAKEVVKRFLPNPAKGKTLEFGSNDGVLLRPLAGQGVGTVIGVDPAKNIVESIEDEKLVLVNDFFNVPTAKQIVKQHGKVDIVMANNVYAHITDINGTTEAIMEVLNDDGVFVFEVHYLGKIIEELQYDFIYHEHTYYYSLIALEKHLARHGMVVFDLKPIPIHGGSIRYYATRKNSKHANTVSKAVTNLRKKEIQLGYDKAETYKKFAREVEQKKIQLMELVNELKAKGCSMAGYGASGRANTIIQYCGINNEHLEFIIDDAPAKQGLYTPGSHIQIRSNQALMEEKPDYVLLFAWAFSQEIVAKSKEYINQGGSFIVPLPEVKVVNHSKKEQYA